MKIKGRPVAVILVSILFIVTGCMGIVYHSSDFADPGFTPLQLTWTVFVRVLAIVCGILLLYRIAFARWLAIAWLGYHVIIGALHSSSQMVTHLIFLAIVSVLLFLPSSSRYFQYKAGNA